MGSRFNKEDLQKLRVEEIEKRVDVVGWDSLSLFKELIEQNNLCVKDVQCVMKDLAQQNYKFKDGRVMMGNQPVVKIRLSDEYYFKYWAQKTFHINPLTCVNVKE